MALLQVPDHLTLKFNRFMTESAILWTSFSLFCNLECLPSTWAVFHRKSHKVGIREALTWTAVWVTLTMTFNLFHLLVILR